MLRSDTQLLTARIAEIRPALFDYCMRMTGDLMKSTAVVQEACNAVAASSSGGGRIDSPDDVRASLFREARMQAGPAWRADTGALLNHAFSSMAASTRTSELVRLDEVLRQLPGEQREAILLVERYGFSVQVAAEIAGLEILRFDEVLARAWQSLLIALPPGAVPVGTSGKAGPIELIPNHPAPDLNDHTPVTNLGEIMEELESTRRGNGWMRGIRFILVLAAAVAVLYWLKLRRHS